MGTGLTWDFSATSYRRILQRPRNTLDEGIAMGPPMVPLGRTNRSVGQDESGDDLNTNGPS